MIIFFTLLFVLGMPIIFMIVYFVKFTNLWNRAKIEAPKEVVVKEVVDGSHANTAANSCPQRDSVSQLKG